MESVKFIEITESIVSQLVEKFKMIYYFLSSIYTVVFVRFSIIKLKHGENWPYFWMIDK